VRFYSHQLDLRGGYQHVQNRFRPSVRQALRKTERGELTACVDQSEQGMRTFYALHVQTRRRHGVPPQSLSFFLNIYREIIQRSMGFVVLVHAGTRPVSAMVFFNWGRTAIYKFGASDKSFQELRPNNLAMATGIKSLADSGSETLLFGRSSLSNAGLRRFKLSWGAGEKELNYYRYDSASGDWGRTYDRTEGLHTELFRRLPTSLNRLAGALIYSHLD
jgi:lipid II:glycine glycyltransferase (peptidoglycan interpeptide bridge formation enzyme)